MSRFDHDAYKRIRNEMRAAGDEIRRIAAKKTISQSDERRLEELEIDFDRLMDTRKELERDALERRIDPLNGDPLLSEFGHTPSRDLDGDPIGEPRSTENRYHRDPWDLLSDGDVRSASPAEWKSRALSAIENAHGANADSREAMTKVLEEFDDKQASLARQALLTSDPAYVRWFGEMLRTGGLNPLVSPIEIEAARRVRAATRAMSLTDTSGGYLVPFQLDPAVIITSDGSFNPIRRVARQVMATGDVWHGVSSAGVSWSWDSEAEEVSDDATTLAQPSITIHAARGFVPFSYEVLDDAANLTQEVTRLLAFGREELTANAFATGSGSGEPIGIITALTGAAPPVVTATTNDAFGAEDIYKLDEALPARYRQSPRAAWFANRAIWNDADQFETSNGSKLFPGVVGNPGTLLGSRTFEMEGMDGTIATGDDYVLVYGDFDHYVIADRATSVEFVPHLFGTSGNRPTGQRGLFAFYRVGADSVNDAAFKLLKV